MDSGVSDFLLFKVKCTFGSRLLVCDWCYTFSSGLLDIWGLRSFVPTSVKIVIKNKRAQSGQLEIQAGASHSHGFRRESSGVLCGAGVGGGPEVLG